MEEEDLCPCQEQNLNSQMSTAYPVYLSDIIKEVDSISMASHLQTCCFLTLHTHFNIPATSRNNAGKSL
jgi:hypothetical protein